MQSASKSKPVTACAQSSTGATCSVFSRALTSCRLQEVDELVGVSRLRLHRPCRPRFGDSPFQLVGFLIGLGSRAEKPIQGGRDANAPYAHDDEGER